MIEEVIAGALANVASGVLAEMARRLGIVRRAAAEQWHRAELELAIYFNTYTFTQDAAPELVRCLTVTGSTAELDTVIQRLDSDRCHAVLHELLAARLTGAPEQQLDRLRGSFSRALWPLGALDRDAAHQIAEAAFEYFDDRLSEVVARLEGALPEIASELRGRAIGLRVVAILDAIERHEAALSDEEDYLEDQKFLARYRRHVVEEFGMLTPPDLQQRRRIPIEDLYVPPDITLIPLIADHTDIQTPRPLLTQFAVGIDRTVLLGDPGAGKTTAARALMHRYARDGASVSPLLVTLRDFAADGAISRSVVQFIEHEMDVVYQCAPPRGWVRRQLLDGSALVIFDGLDELIDTSRRAQISSVIEHFCIEFPLTRVLVTSRFVGYDQASLDERHFIKHRIENFDDEKVTKYARKWFASDRTLTADRAGRDADAFVAESASVADLRSNPLMLSLMCVLYRGEGYIPEHRAQVYRMCAELLFHRWDASRHIHVALTLSQAQVQRLLRALAHWLLTREDTSTAVTERQLVAKTAALLLERDMDEVGRAEATAAQFVEFCRGRGWIFVDVGTTAAGEPLYAFAHRTFLEYFTAAHLSTHAETPEALASVLAQRVVLGEWDVIAQLAIAMKDESSAGGGERALQALLTDERDTSEPARRFVLLIAASCLDSLDLTPDFVKAFTRRALDHVLDPRAEVVGRDAVLAWSRLNVRRWRELVAAEFTARAESLINSDDIRKRALGFYLVMGDVTAVQAKVDNRDFAFWENWTHNNAITWREAIRRAASSEQSILNLALDHELLPVREALALPNGMIRLITSFIDPLMGYHQRTWLGWRSHMFRIDPARHESFLSALRDLGLHLLSNNPQHPFTGTVPWFDEVPDGYAGGVLPPGMSIEGSIYLAVAMLTAIEIESQASYHSSNIAVKLAAARADGWLSAFLPYIQVRVGIIGEVPTRLVPLPMREDYRELFRAWAHGEVNFTRTPAEQAGE